MNKTTFGRMRGGHSTALLITLSVLCGALISGGLGWLLSLRYPELATWLVVAIGIACMMPVLTMLAWALLVDFSTVKGRADRLEDSVENHWAREASSGMGLDMLLTLGLTTTVVSIGGFSLPTDNLLLGLLLIAMSSFAIRYLIAQRKGS